MPECIQTQAELGERVNLSQSQVSRKLRDRDCPINPTPPWDADDLADFRDFVAGPGGEDQGDRLKQAQAVKAQVLAAKYLLEMATGMGKLGDELFEAFTTAIGISSVTHFGAAKMKLGQLLEAHGHDPHDAIRAADEFAYWFYTGHAVEVTRIFIHKYRADEALGPIAAQMQRAVKNLRTLGDVPESALQEIEETIGPYIPELTGQDIDNALAEDPSPAAAGGGVGAAGQAINQD